MKIFKDDKEFTIFLVIYFRFETKFISVINTPFGHGVDNIMKAFSKSVSS